MKIGFTGTRSGMSSKQVREVVDKIIEIGTLNIKKVIHGGCIGADMDFHAMFTSKKIEVYPGHSSKNIKDKSLQGEFGDANIIHESQTHFKRNRDIVDNCDILFATPYNNIQRGGTWYTINYARKIGKEVIIFER